MIFKLSPSHIDVCLFTLTQQPQWALDVLNQEEKARAMQFYFERHRRRFITARAMLRFVLGQYLNRSPQSIDFYYNEYGKPGVLSPLQIAFNLSHSEDYAVLAIGQQHDLGVDLEYFSVRQYLDLAHAYFAKTEIERLHRVPDAMKPMIFFQIWTQKEAFIKAIGAGLSYPTDTFYAQPDHAEALLRAPHVMSENASQRLRLIDPQNESLWFLDTMMPIPGFCMSVCYRPDVETLQYAILNPEDAA